MKNKAFLSLLLIVAMLFTLVACEQPQNGCQHVDSDADGKCDLCQVTIEQSGNGSGNGSGSGSGDGATVVKGEQVTAEVWVQQFSIESPAQYYTNYTLEASSSVEDYYTQIYQRDGDRSREAHSYNDSMSEYVYEKIDEELYKEYHVADGKREISYGDGNGSIDLDFDEIFYPILSTTFVNQYSNVTFDNSTGCYALGDTQVTVLGTSYSANGTVSFVDNKLVAVHVVYTTDEGDNIHWTFEVGNTVINIPQPSSGTDEQGISEVVWNEQLQSLFENNSKNIGFSVGYNSIGIYDDKMWTSYIASGSVTTSVLWVFNETGADVYTYDQDSGSYTVQSQQITKAEAFTNELAKLLDLENPYVLTNSLIDMFSLAEYDSSSGLYKICFGGSCGEYSFHNRNYCRYIADGYSLTDDLKCVYEWLVGFNADGEMNYISGYLLSGDGGYMFRIGCGTVSEFPVPTVPTV